MGIKIYNSLTRKKEEFVPNKKNEVSIYLCGPTVYDYFHIGNGRTFMIFDVFRRFLEYKGHKVKYIKNLTDVDDKLIKKSSQTGKTVKEVADFYISAYYKDCEKLRIKPADVNPRATGFIGPMIDMVKELIKKEYAYVVDNDVFYNVGKFKTYGELSGKRIDDLISGHRVEVDERKKSPLDFALWKAAKPGEISWDSPWGPGRPGWHLECSVMSHHFLGDTFDIHCGGEDLIFPHHENERAQSIACYGGGFARYWMHSHFLNMGKEKMSKSLGNIISVHELLEQFSPEAVRIFFLQKHYRQTMVFEEELLKDTEKAADRLKRIVSRLKEVLGKDENFENLHLEFDPVKKAEEKIIQVLEDDFNTPEAIAAVFDAVRFVNTFVEGNKTDSDYENNLKQALGFFQRIDSVFGIFAEDKPEDSGDLDNVMNLLISLRKDLRAGKNWALADKIRDELDKLGFVVEDKKDGVRWYKK